MTLEEIKSAVESGQKVFWKNTGYEVIKDRIGQWFIKCNFNNHLIGLTHADKVTMNGKPEDFWKDEVLEPDARYPFTYALDYLRDFGGVDKGGLRLNRADASGILSAVAKALDMESYQLAVKLANYAKDHQDELSKAAADRLIKAIR